MMGTTSDPADGKAVAFSIFIAVAVYAVSKTRVPDTSKERFS